MAETFKGGDPYRLAGNRIAFTNWHFIQSGMGMGAGWSLVDTGVHTGLMSEFAGGDTRVQWEPGFATHGVRLVTEAARHGLPLFTYDKPWEKHGLSASVMKDRGVYRAWASTGLHARDYVEHNFTCYLESDDGYVWRKPDLDIIRFAGGKSNIIDDKLGYRLHPITVFIDPSAPAPERYKCISEWEFTQQEFDDYAKRRPDAIDLKARRNDMKPERYLAVIGAASPDGLRWTLTKDPLVMLHSDTSMTGYYDQTLKKYVAYFRDYLIGAQADDFERVKPHGSGFWKRAIGRAETADFLNFPLPSLVLAADPSWSPTQQLYTNCRTTIPGAPDHHLMFPSVWDTSDDTTSIVLATSHDGKYWQYAPNPVVMNTNTSGEWDGGCVFAYPDLIELPNGDFALPYTGYDVGHKYPRKKAKRNTAYALWPKGRISGIAAAEDGAFMSTALIPPGQKAFINAVVKRAGFIRVEVCDMNGTIIAGREFENSVHINGDCYKTPITWNGTDMLGVVPGTPLCLRFTMRRATVYGIEFK